MRKLLSKLYNNRYTIMAGIMAIIVLLIIVRGLDGALKNAKEGDSRERAELKKVENDKLSIRSPEGDKIKVEVAKSNEACIEDFFEFLNNGKIEEAYEMIDEECKNALYKNIETFTKDYYNRKFAGNYWVPGISLKRATGNKYIYNVGFYEDMLSTGKASGAKKSDTITVIDYDGTKKLYVGDLTSVDNKEYSKEYNNIKIIVKEQTVYKENTVVKVNITNNSDKTIFLARNGHDSSIFLNTSDGVKYSSRVNEIHYTDLIFKPGESRDLDIKFARREIRGERIESVVFGGIVDDYDSYMEKPEELDHLLRIVVDIK